MDAHTCVRAQQTHQRARQEVQLSEMNKQPLHRKKAGQKIKPACMFPQGVYVCVCVCAHVNPDDVTQHSAQKAKLLRKLSVSENVTQRSAIHAEGDLNT